MKILPLLITEMEEEAVTTRQFLERVPMDKPDYKPHPKSMAMKDLVIHLAELAGWPEMAFSKNEVDFANFDYKPKPFESREELLNILNQGLASSKAALEGADEARLSEPWVLRTGEQIHATYTRYTMIRMALDQTIHHRAQLGVYFRLLDIPVPGSYGPSADEQDF